MRFNISPLAPLAPLSPPVICTVQAWIKREEGA